MVVGFNFGGHVVRLLRVRVRVELCVQLERDP